MAIRSSKRPFITTASEAIDTLGGTFKVADMLGDDPRTVSNWRLPTRGLPPNTRDALGAALTAKGVRFDPTQLFGQRTINPYSNTDTRKRPAKPRQAQEQA